MNEQEKAKAKEKVEKLAASMGMKITIVKETSDKVYFPEKLEQANKILAKTNFTNIKLNEDKKQK